MRKVLLIAFHFPPFAQSSGIQRTLRFAQYLPEYGWEPTVLTTWAAAYESTQPESVENIPKGCRVIRAPAANVAKHLALAGRYPRRFAVPDRWASWNWPATLAGIRACQKHRIDAIWSTYPIATAHRIGANVADRTGLPWIADFRDPMVQVNYPPDPKQFRAFEAIESEAAAKARTIVLTTMPAVEMYRQRYPNSQVELVENGYDESSFLGLEQPDQRNESDPILILHSGAVYPDERDPKPLFEALSRIKKQETPSSRRYIFRFRASEYPEFLRELAELHDIADRVEICDALPYRKALQEMFDADYLLIMQADNCNEQIPAKLYEYFRAGKPIIALTDPAGATGAKLLDLGFSNIANLKSVDSIQTTVTECVKRSTSKTQYVLSPDCLLTYSRKSQTGTFAKILDNAVDGSSV